MSMSVPPGYMHQFQNPPHPPHQQRNKQLITAGVVGVCVAAAAYLLYKSKSASTTFEEVKDTAKTAVKDVTNATKSQAQRINMDEHKTLAKKYYEDKQFNNAINSYKEAIQYEPTKHGLHTNLSNVLYDIKQYGEALKYADSSLAIKQTANALYTKGRALIGMKQYDKAIEHLNKATALEDYHKVKNQISTELKKAQAYIRRTTRAPQPGNSTGDSQDDSYTGGAFTEASDMQDSNGDSDANNNVFGGKSTVKLNADGRSKSDLDQPESNDEDIIDEPASPVDLPAADANYDVDAHKVNAGKSFASLLKDVPDEMKAMPKPVVNIVSEEEAASTVAAPPVGTVHASEKQHGNSHHNHRGSGKKQAQKYVPVNKSKQ